MFLYIFNFLNSIKFRIKLMYYTPHLSSEPSTTYPAQAHTEIRLLLHLRVRSTSSFLSFIAQLFKPKNEKAHEMDRRFEALWSKQTDKNDQLKSSTNPNSLLFLGIAKWKSPFVSSFSLLVSLFFSHHPSPEAENVLLCVQVPLFIHERFIFFGFVVVISKF